MPRHRGVFGSRWTLFDNDNQEGSTIHTMELKLDAGEIVKQIKFNIYSKDSQYSITVKTKRDMAYSLLDIFRNDHNHHIKASYKLSYHKAPSRELAKEFNKKGKNNK